MQLLALTYQTYNPRKVAPVDFCLPIDHASDQALVTEPERLEFDRDFFLY